MVGPIELEFAVELRQDAKAKLGFWAWVLSGDAEAGVSRGRTHRVKVVLNPKRPGGGDLLVSGAAEDAVGAVTEAIGILQDVPDGGEHLERAVAVRAWLQE